MADDNNPDENNGFNYFFGARHAGNGKGYYGCLKEQLSTAMAFAGSSINGMSVKRKPDPYAQSYEPRGLPETELSVHGNNPYIGRDGRADGSLDVNLTIEQSDDGNEITIHDRVGVSKNGKEVAYAEEKGSVDAHPEPTTGSLSDQMANRAVDLEKWAGNALRTCGPLPRNAKNFQPR